MTKTSNFVVFSIFLMVLVVSIANAGTIEHNKEEAAHLPGPGVAIDQKSLQQTTPHSMAETSWGTFRAKLVTKSKSLIDALKDKSDELYKSMNEEQEKLFSPIVGGALGNFAKNLNKEN